MTITYNHIITQHFSSGIQRLASMTTLPAQQKRYLVKHLLPTFQEEIQIYAKLEKEIFEQHTT